MTSLGMCALFFSVTPTQAKQNPLLATATTAEDVSPVDRSIKSKRVNGGGVRLNRSASTTPGLYSYMTSPRRVFDRYVFGIHEKTKRSLAEEAESGDDSSLSAWIREGVSVDEVDHYGYTALLNASTTGRLNAVRELIKNGADVNKVGPFGFTPLHAAAQNGHREVVAFLLKSGANINAQNDDRDTALHLAIRATRIEIVYMLLRSGGNAKIIGFNNKDCIQTAREAGLKDMANTLKNFNPSLGFHPHTAYDFRP